MSWKSLPTGLVCGLVLVGQPVLARSHRHHAHVVNAVAPAPHPQAYSFYPNDTPGGVTGNLPFNNQVRKLSDPLNANGAGR